jgi:hypothetical protein
VIVAVAVLPALLSVIVVVPTPAAVTVIAAPLVAETLAIEAFAEAHPSGAEGIALFRPSKAWPVKLTVAPAFSVAVVGLTTTRATAGETDVRSEAVLLAVFVSDPPLTVAVLVTLPAAFAATVTVTITAGYDALAANAVDVVHVRVASVQVQPEPLIAVAVKPAGNASTTVTVPAVGALPTLETVNVYVAPTWPSAKLPTCVDVTVTSGARGVTVVTSVAVLLAVFVSPPPLTVALLVRLAPALLATVTVRVMGEYAAPPPSGLVFVQVAVATVQVQPEPLIAVAVRPTGSVSARVTVPTIWPAPTLDTVTV